MVTVTNRVEKVGRYKCPNCGTELIWDWIKGYKEMNLLVLSHNKSPYCALERKKREARIRFRNGFGWNDNNTE
jgi:hypothetical protein